MGSHTPLIHVGRSKHKKPSTDTPGPEAQLGKQVGEDHPDPSLENTAERKNYSAVGIQEGTHRWLHPRTGGRFPNNAPKMFGAFQLSEENLKAFLEFPSSTHVSTEGPSSSISGTWDDGRNFSDGFK